MATHQILRRVVAVSRLAGVWELETGLACACGWVDGWVGLVHLPQEEDVSEDAFLRKARAVAPKDGTPSLIRFDHGEGMHGGVGRVGGLWAATACCVCVRASQCVPAPAPCHLGAGKFTAVDQQLFSHEEVDSVAHLPVHRMEIWQVRRGAPALPRRPPRCV